ncbi:hypothetical protein IAQ61_002469 [Plenodomus lingam]|uniref:uncharacterized protein n=1 Tax=Leptosphaeria maculans TaxID=5022 RepID=UPI003317D024|nr:hypothetical protein IAQ61_002469 [Plenodomus lingam]
MPRKTAGSKFRGAASGVYGPSNPPPPPPGRPPNVPPPPPGGPSSSKKEKSAKYYPKVPDKTPEEVARIMANRKAKAVRKALRKVERYQQEGLPNGLEPMQVSTYDSKIVHKAWNGPIPEVVTSKVEDVHLLPARGRDEVARMHDRDEGFTRPRPSGDEGHPRADRVGDFSRRGDSYRPTTSSTSERSYRDRSPASRREQRRYEHGKKADTWNPYNSRYRSRSRSPVRQESGQNCGRLGSSSNHDDQYAQQAQTTNTDATHDHVYPPEDEVDYGDDDADVRKISERLAESETSSWQFAVSPVSHEWQNGNEDHHETRNQQDKGAAWENHQSYDAGIGQGNSNDCYPGNDARYDRRTLPQAQSQHYTPAPESFAQTGIIPTIEAPKMPLPAPVTAFSLWRYDGRLLKLMPARGLDKQFSTCHGKVKPLLYCGDRNHDLGLCYATFLTDNMCEMGQKCWWRHHPLRQDEVDWITSHNKTQATQFLKDAEKFWASPTIPLPGANLSTQSN